MPARPPQGKRRRAARRDGARPVEQLVADLQLALAGDDLAAVKRATEALNQGTVEFAARRMNASVKQALTGQRLDALEI